jgi:predicted CoA-binding protein
MTSTHRSYSNMKILFSFNDCVALRYFVPLIKEARNRGHDIFFNVLPSDKYNSPDLPENRHQIDEIIYTYNIIPSNRGDVCFTIEGVETNPKCLNITFAIIQDFSTLYDGYIDRVDNVIFQSRWFAEKYDKVTSKNLYLGLPKYDIDGDLYNRDTICSKYRLDKTKKYALIVYPRNPDRHKFQIDNVCNDLYKHGYEIIIKSRKKDKFWLLDEHTYRCFYDVTWYPPTMLELIYISSLVVNTDSCTVKEAAMLERPIVNIENKTYRVMEQLYEDNAKAKYLTPVNTDGTASQRILDYVSSL